METKDSTEDRRNKRAVSVGRELGVDQPLGEVAVGCSGPAGEPGGHAFQAGRAARTNAQRRDGAWEMPDATRASDARRAAGGAVVELDRGQNTAWRAGFL